MKNKYSILFLLLFAQVSVFAQYGVLDPTLQPGSGADNTVQVVAVQPDSKIIIGGDFLTYNGVNKKRIARLHPDGTIDTSFNIGSGANNVIMSIVVQPDDKIILAGAFSVFSNTAQKRIVRLNPNGSIDTSFNPGFGANDDIWCAYLLPDGKIMVGGMFTSFNWIARNGLARLNADGSLDETFVSDAPLTSVTEINFLEDGKMLINGTNKLVRINADGSVDNTFETGAGTDYPIQAVHMQSNGKIVVGGYFTSYNNLPFNRILRLNLDGSIDTTFNAGSGADYGVLTITEQTDGQLLISGLFSSYNGNEIEKIARMGPDGEFDSSFHPGMGPDNIVLHHLVQPDGRVLLVGDFASYNGVSRSRVARVSGHLVLSADEHAASQSMSVFPNPTNSDLEIQLPNGVTADGYSIFDLTGKQGASFSSTLNLLDVRQLSSGVYIL
ncbi:MAG TPA: T9SS type A sorting domain-containing protein, partial [Flavobacterium sp.]